MTDALPDRPVSRHSGQTAIGRLPVLMAAAWMLLALIMFPGCRKTSNHGGPASTVGQTSDAQTREDLLQSALDTLMRVEELCNLNSYYAPPNGSRDRIFARLENWMDTRDPPIGWEPTPNEMALRQMIDRLNQWNPSHVDDVDWQAEPIAPQLPAPLQGLASEEALRDDHFTMADARFLELSVWLRDVSNRAVAGKSNDLERATALFDWTVRNIQLKAESSENRAVHLPWHTMLLGRGTDTSRAWLFMLLARQQGLHVVMLAHADAAASTPSDWLPALFSEGKLYLFDPWLGLPIPGPGGEGVATLHDAIQDEAILNNLDLTERRPYPVKSRDLSRVIAFYETSPEALSRRMAALESRLAADQKLVLTTRPGELAEKLKANTHIDEVRPWPHPYETIQQAYTAVRPAREQAVAELIPLMTPPLLWRGRMRYLRGQWEGERNAVSDFLDSRTPDEAIATARVDEKSRAVLAVSKQHATYWLGLLSYENGSHDAAVLYLDRLTLQKWPDGPWEDGARYNLARVYEATGLWEKAVAAYETDITAQLHGNRLRGQWLAAEHRGDSASE